MEVTRIVHGGYENNPIVKHCASKIMQQVVGLKTIQLDDLGDVIEKCNHSKECIEIGNMTSYIGDQVRMYLGMKDNIFYMDADAYVNNIKDIPLNSIAVENNKINDGTFFYGNKKWCEYYYNLYQKKYLDLIYDNGQADVNYVVRARFPSNIPFNRIDTRPGGNWGVHYYLSQFNRFKKITEDRRTVCYTFNDGMNYEKENNLYWHLGKSALPITVGALNNHCWYYNLKNLGDLDIELWKEQIRYTLGNSFIYFREI